MNPRKLLILAPLSITFYVIASSTNPPGNGTTSQLWGENGELHSSTSRLPDFSFAGFASGEATIPDLPVVANAADFGANGSDNLDDTAAIRNAINATNNGALYIPPGTYILSSRIYFNKSNFVIRGAGEGQTIFYMPQSLSTLEGRAELPYDGGFFQIGGSPSSGSLIGSLASNASRGDYAVTLNTTPTVTVGQKVRLRSNNANSLGLHLLNGQTVGSQTPSNFFYYTDTVLKVAAVNGNQITFDRPLRLDARPEWASQIRTYSPAMTNFGLEDVTFKFGGTPKRAHNDEEGFNAIDFTGGENCWVRRVTFIDADNCLLVKDSRFCQFSDLTFKAELRSGNDTGHHGLWVKEYTQGCLFTAFDFQTSFVHDLSVEGLAHANVFSKGSGVRLNLDHHANLPYENLFTDLQAGNIGRLYASGGASTRKPHTASRSTIWNIQKTSGNAPSIPNWPLFNVIGVAGYTPSTNPTGNTWIEPISNLNPPDLHLAQQQKRLGTTPIDLPTPIIISTGTGGNAPLTLQFDGSQSTIPNGSISSYTWDFGDGTTANGATTSHTFPAGTFDVCLIVTGDNGSSASTNLTINSGSLLSLQAEDANISNGAIESNHQGFNETGFVNLNPTSSSIEWNNVDGASGGPTTVTIRYALGNNDRTANLIVNGNTQPITFANTGAWNNWVELTAEITLNSGTTNTIRIETTGQDSGNIDQISLPSSSSNLPSYSQWQSTQTWGSIPASQQELNNDPDGDGLNNGLERVLGTSPTSPNPNYLSNTLSSSNTNTISFSYPKTSYWFTTNLEQSTDLENWTNVDSVTEYYNSQTQQYFINHPLTTDNDPKYFYRLTFSQ